MQEYVQLNAWQVGLAAALLTVNGIVSWQLRLGQERSLLLAGIRTVIQLLLIGLVLEWVFQLKLLPAILAIMLVMTLIAGVTAWQRADRGYPGVLLNTIVSVWASSWLVLAFAMFAILQGERAWYDPQYAIPLLGMILGNTLNGITLGLNSVVESLVARRDEVETLLALGGTRFEAARAPIQQAVKMGLTPIINSMMVVGLVSLPGMMTGQLLAGVAPLDAVKYQMVIMFLIASATALGVVGVVLLTFFRLFNAQHQFLHGLIRARNSRG